jgi:sugar diacid utilization regulator
LSRRNLVKGEKILSLCYLEHYNALEPVNCNQFTKKRKVYVRFNENFFRKLETDEKIKALPVEIRDTVILSYILDMKISDVAKMLHVHRNTVTNRLKIAEKLIGKC